MHLKLFLYNILKWYDVATLNDSYTYSRDHERIMLKIKSKACLIDSLMVTFPVVFNQFKTISLYGLSERTNDDGLFLCVFCHIFSDVCIKNCKPVKKRRFTEINNDMIRFGELFPTHTCFSCFHSSKVQFISKSYKFGENNSKIKLKVTYIKSAYVFVKVSELFTSR